jgi:DNA ligase-associated metallophosphoesterase
MIKLSGMETQADVTGALHVPDFKALLVADLHFEKGSARAGRGVHLPPYDTRSTLVSLTSVVERFQPERLISLGDSFHDTTAGERLDDDDRAGIKALSERCDVYWLTGNHDPDAAGDVGGQVVDEVVLGPLTLRHIPQSGQCSEIAGHLHPVASVVRRGRRLRRKCFIADQSRMVLPAFGAYTGGLSIWAEPFHGLFGDGGFGVWMLGRDKVYKVRNSLLIKPAP